jgi:hypothetical protein
MEVKWAKKLLNIFVPAEDSSLWEADILSNGKAVLKVKNKINILC